MNHKCITNNIVDIIGLCDVEKIKMNEPKIKITEQRNGNDAWTQISIPDIVEISSEKPPIRTLDKIFVDVKIKSSRIVKTYKAGKIGILVENEEGTRLTGWKLIIEGLICQKLVYTADVEEQTVHSADFKIPFSAVIILKEDTNEADEFCITPCIEDVFTKVLNSRKVFKDVTLFLKADKLPT